MLLTDPLLGNSSFNNNLLMTPFQTFNKVNVIYLPITGSIGCCNVKDMQQFLSQVAAKRVLTDEKTKQYLDSETNDKLHNLNVQALLAKGTNVNVSNLQ